MNENPNIADLPQGPSNELADNPTNKSDVDISQGYPLPGNTAPTNVPGVGQPSPESPSGEAGAAPVAEQPESGTNVPSEEEQAIQRRENQEIARKNKMLAALGLDPLSDLGEQLEKGLISEEDLRNHVARQYGTQQQPQQQESVNVPLTPVSQAQSDFDTAKARYDAEAATGEIQLATNNDYMDAIQKLNDAKIDALKQDITADKQSQQVNENVEAVLSVARNQPEYNQMEEALKPEVDMVQVAFTDMLASQECPKMGLDYRALDSRQYRYFSEKASERLGKIANFYIELGRQEVRNGMRPINPNVNNMPVPSAPGGTPAAAPNAYGKVTHQNHEEAARQFMRNSGRI